MTAEPALWTVGHGARPLAELLAVLAPAGIAVVVDVRRFPGSRRHPQYGRQPLADGMAAAGVGYEWQGEQLGGRRSRSPESRHTGLRVAAFAGYADHIDGAGFRVAADALVARAAVERIAVMCAETPWWRCHRRMIADALTMRGTTVTHLLDPSREEPHRPHPAVRRGNDGWPVYDRPADDSDPLPGL